MIIYINLSFCKVATCRPTPVGMFSVGKDNICLIEDVTGNSSHHTSHFTLSPTLPSNVWDVIIYCTLNTARTFIQVQKWYYFVLIHCDEYPWYVLYVIRLFWAKNDMQCDPFDPPTNANFAEKMEFPLFRILFSPFSS